MNFFQFSSDAKNLKKSFVQITKKDHSDKTKTKNYIINKFIVDTNYLQLNLIDYYDSTSHIELIKKCDQNWIIANSMDVEGYNILFLSKPESLFESISNDLLFEILKKTNLKTIHNLLLMNKKSLELITYNKYWGISYENDFLNEYNYIIGKNLMWKKLYQEKIGTIMSFGKNNYGQLGLGHSKNMIIPTKLPTNINVKKIFAGENKSYLIDINNNVYMCGQSREDGYSNKYIFMKLEHPVNKSLPLKATDVAVSKNGARNTHIIDIDNNVLSYDYNGNYIGKLFDFKIRKISVGYDHTLILDMEGNIWSYGQNYVGQLGLGDTDDRDVPFKITKIYRSPFVDKREEINFKVKDIYAGEDISGFIDENNIFYMMGKVVRYKYLVSIRDNIILIPTAITSNVKKISINNNFSLLINTNDDVSSFGQETGKNEYIFSEIMEKNRNIIHERAKTNLKKKGISMFNVSDPKIWDNEIILAMEELFPSSNLDFFVNLDIKAKDISTSEDHALILDLDGNVWHFGNSKKSKNIPIKVENIKAKAVSAGDNFSLFIV